jgi:DNA-binding MarR family transcriptional regulator
MVEFRLGYLLKHAWLELGAHTGPALEPWSLDGRELAVLGVLDADEPPAQRQAAERLGVDRTTMVALVDELERKGYVERRADPDDRRRNLVHLTTAGRQARRDATRAADEAEQGFLAALSPAERTALRDMLRRIVGGPR